MRSIRPLRSVLFIFTSVLIATQLFAAELEKGVTPAITCPANTSASELRHAKLQLIQMQTRNEPDSVLITGTEFTSNDTTYSNILLATTTFTSRAQSPTVSIHGEKGQRGCQITRPEFTR